MASAAAPQRRNVAAPAPESEGLSRNALAQQSPATPPRDFRLYTAMPPIAFSEPYGLTYRSECAMEAAVVTDFHAPLQIRDLPIPEPGPGDVLVRMEVTGLCHTDIHAAQGDWPVQPVLPFVPGHEGVGIVDRLGAGVTTRTVGDRVVFQF